MNPKTGALSLKEAPQARAIQEKPRAPWTNGSTLTTGISAAPWLRDAYIKHVPMLAAAMGVSVTETEKKEKPGTITELPVKKEPEKLEKVPTRSGIATAPWLGFC